MKKKFGTGKSYADILTLLLVIIIIAIIALVGYLAYRVVDKKKVDTNAESATQEFLATAEENKKMLEELRKSTNTVDNTVTTTEGPGNYSGIIDYNSLSQPSQNGSSGNSSSSNVEIKKTYVGNYEVKGSIDIPKTKCKYAILEKVTPDSLSKSIAIMDIVSNPELQRDVKDLNVPGTNAFILGHNYRNGQFFSDNDKLVKGDKIKITDQTGTEITYTIYDMFYTDPNDISFMKRDIDINTREITLQTCNDNSSERLIILAKDN